MFDTIRNGSSDPIPASTASEDAPQLTPPRFRSSGSEKRLVGPPNTHTRQPTDAPEISQVRQVYEIRSQGSSHPPAPSYVNGQHPPQPQANVLGTPLVSEWRGAAAVLIIKLFTKLNLD